MRLATFSYEGQVRIGVLDPLENLLTDLSSIAPHLPKNMSSLIVLGVDGLNEVKKTLEKADQDNQIPIDKVTLNAPIWPPVRDPFAVGRNYHEHAKEFHDSGFDATSGSKAVPDHPIIFTKATTSVTGPFDPVPAHLDKTNTTDYEGELAVIIGPGGRGISKSEALNHVYGYTVSNDVTARTLQHQHKQWNIGKGIDGYCPMGPYLLTSDEAGDVNDMHLQTWVNGELRQDALVKDLIFDVPTLVATISENITLLPGDIILTGTPVGVGIGFQPPVFLKSGDLVKVSIDPIGTIENKII